MTSYWVEFASEIPSDGSSVCL